MLSTDDFKVTSPDTTFTGGRSYMHRFILHTWNNHICEFVVDPEEQLEDLLAFVQPLQGYVLKNAPVVSKFVAQM